MNKRQYTLLIFGLTIGSYAYIFDMMFYPGILLSIFNLIVGIFINIDNLYKTKNNIFNLVMILFMIITFNVFRMEYIFNGLTFVTSINIVVTNQLFSRYKRNDFYLEGIFYKVLIMYLSILILILLLPFISKWIVFISVSSLFMPFIIKYMIIYLNCYNNDEVRYDTISSN